MKFIKVTCNKETYYINCDKIHYIKRLKDVTLIDYGMDNYALYVDQTPEEILELIKKEVANEQ